MFCEECGKQIPDNSKFCDGCGAPVKSVQRPGEEPKYEEPRYEEPRYDGPKYEEPRYEGPKYEGPRYEEPRYERSVYERPQEYGYPEKEEKRKKGGAQTALIVVLSVVAVALIVVLVVLGIRTFGGKKDGGGESQIAAGETRETKENLFEKEEEASQAESTALETTAPETVPPATETPAPSTAAPPETTVPPTTEAVSEYILPTSNSAYLTEADLAPLTKEQLRLARNEIYARHGRKFKDAALNEYFLSKSWYVPTIEPDRFNENVFNSYETANRKLIADYEKKMGY